MFLDGSDTLGGERFGKEIGTVLESDMPAMLAELGKTVQSSGLTWAQWREQFPDALLETVKKYL